MLDEHPDRTLDTTEIDLRFCEPGLAAHLDLAFDKVHYCNLIEAPWLVNGGHGA
eukprot:COSAG01_NODE_3761_length_5722_cov_2.962298_7_plen_54_part_00